jgi:hypothetical protein
LPDTFAQTIPVIPFFACKTAADHTFRIADDKPSIGRIENAQIAKLLFQMNDELGQQVESLYQSRFRWPFPYRDCRLVARQCGVDTADLIPELDTFFAEIAGFSSSATKLSQRPVESLRRAQFWMSRDFFERHPSLAVCRDHIDEEHTPDLWRQMRVAEELRCSLLRLLDGMGIRQA